MADDDWDNEVATGTVSTPVQKVDENNNEEPRRKFGSGFQKTNDSESVSI